MSCHLSAASHENPTAVPATEPDQRVAENLARVAHVDLQERAQESRETRVSPETADSKQRERPKFAAIHGRAAQFSLLKGEFEFRWPPNLV